MTYPSPSGMSPLVGTMVRLDRSIASDAAGIFTALDHEQVYAGAYHGGARPAAASEIVSWMKTAEQTGRVMYTVRLAADGPLGSAGLVVGTTSLGDIDLVNAGVHLGWTAYSPSVWGTAVNPECKLLLLRHAFDECAFERVKIQTDRINERSQGAIAKLGATREGVLRHHRRRADGSWRDTVVFSILAAEWPTVRDRLARRVQSLIADRG